jgi:hypothetical protein
MELILKISFFALIALAILIMILNQYKKDTGILFSILNWLTATFLTVLTPYYGNVVAGSVMAIVSFGSLLFFKFRK